MTGRIERLREKSLSAIPRICIERANLFTDAYIKYEGKYSIPETRALAFLYYIENRSLSIEDGELLVGEKGFMAQAAPTFPEICCHTLDDMRIMNERDNIAFKVSENDLKTQREKIIPFWEKRQLRSKIFDSVDKSWLDCYESGIFTEFMEQRGPGHTVCSGKIYEKGFSEYKDDINEAILKLDFFNDPQALDKQNQLKSMAICCDAIIALGERYASLARMLAGTENNPLRRAELEQIAINCEVVPAHKPRTFWQALQMYWFVHLCVTTELNPWDAYSPGRLDQHVYPFYKNDLTGGVVDEDSALELLECLWIKFNNQPAPPKVGITLKESGTYTDFANINTGGITADGEDGVNDISYLILNCMDEMQLLQPSSNVQISRKNPGIFLKRACEIASKGWGQPAFYNTEAIIQELLNAGKSIADARLGGTSGCVETGAFGNEAYILTGYFNLPKILEITLNNGVDSLTSKKIGLETGYATDFKTYNELWEAYGKQVKHFVDIKVKGSNIIENLYAKYMPVPFLSIITNDCIKKGKDYNAGGARYNTSYIQGVGIGTITDSLAVIKYNIFDYGRFSMDELMKALDCNFYGSAAERVRQLALNKTPKYGNDDDYADGIMKEVFDLFYSQVTGRPNMKGGTYRINMLPTTCHVYFGEVMQASPNGRLAHKPVSEGISPDKGADVNGPTAVIKSAAKMDHLRTGGTLLNQKFSPNVLKGDQGLNAFASLIKAYFNMDGHHIQFNVIDRETLLKAQQYPEEYNNLIVRVAGYSDHFKNLSKALQDEIIDRTEQGGF